MALNTSASPDSTPVAATAQWTRAFQEQRLGFISYEQTSATAIQLSDFDTTQSLTHNASHPVQHVASLRRTLFLFFHSSHTPEEGFSVGYQGTIATP